jgi:isoaspartyl peptidase/L-asparaginase-like protein (Ntn-hydrolase superfamily)
VAALPAVTALPWKRAAICHGGVGSPASLSDGPRAAVDAALRALEAGKDPLDAAVAGVVVLEDDPRFNAGTGSRVRLDGVTVQMDASVMSSEGRFGAVAAIEAVKNPVQVARAVLDTPHALLVGDGATRFARTLGMPPYDPTTPESRAKSEQVRRALLASDPSLPADWRAFDWRGHWNFERSLADAGLSPADAGTETVGCAVRGEGGRFGVALSTGGTSVTLRGRVGDVPLMGAGLFASAAGAFAATGTGERIVEKALARSGVADLERGVSPGDVARHAVDLLRGKDIGVIVIGPDSFGEDADRPMAWAAREASSAGAPPVWRGPGGS